MSNKRVKLSDNAVKEAEAEAPVETEEGDCTEATLFAADLYSPFSETGPKVSDYWREYPPQNRRAWEIVTNPRFHMRATKDHVLLAMRLHDWMMLGVDKAKETTKEKFFKEADKAEDDGNGWLELMLEKTHAHCDNFELYALK